MKSSEKYLLITLHAILIILAYTSWIWLDWRLVALGVAIYYAQIVIFDGCVLSIEQFNDKDMSFHEWYLGKLGIKVNRKALNNILTYVVPVVIVVLSVITQIL